MQMPAGVRQAVALMWLTIFISALSALAQKVIGLTSVVEFSLALFFYAFVCMLPYKVANGSNAARFVYLVIVVLSVFLMLGGAAEMPAIDWYVSLLVIPLDAYAVYRLFQPEAKPWFVGR